MTMPNMSLKQFYATSPILGGPKEVEFIPAPGLETGILHVRGVTVGEALSLLEAMQGSVGHIAAPPAQEAKPATQKAAAKKAEAKTEPAQAAKDHYDASAQRVAETAAAQPEAAKEAQAQTAPPPKTVKQEPKVEPKTNGAFALPEAPTAIKNTTALRDLLVWMADEAKVPDVDTLVAVCTAHKDSFPVLTKIPDVDTRIRRAVTALDLFNPDAVQA